MKLPGFTKKIPFFNKNSNTVKEPVAEPDIFELKATQNIYSNLMKGMNDLNGEKGKGNFIQNMIEMREKMMKNAFFGMGAQFGYQNPQMGVGGQNDLSRGAYRLPPPYISYNIMDNFYRTSWVAKNIIDIPAQDLCRTWRVFKHKDSEVVKKREEAERFYSVQSIIQECLQWADLYGGAAIIWSLDTDTPEIISSSNKLSSIEQGSLQFFQVVIKDQANPSGQYNMDPFDASYLKPNCYTIMSTGDAVVINVDRLIILFGSKLPIYAKMQQNLWGDPKLVPILGIINQVEGMWNSISQMFAASNVDVIKLKDYARAMQATPDVVFKRLGMDKTLISNYNKILLDAEDEFERKELGNLSGLSDVMKLILQMLAGASSIPFTRFMSESIKGFGEGDNEMKMWYEHLNKKRQDLYPCLKKIDQIIEMSVFGKIMDIEYEWQSLDEPNDQQLADIELKRAQRDQEYIQMGVVSPRDVAHALMTYKTYSTITDDRINKYSDELLDPTEILMNPEENDEEDEEKNSTSS